MTPNDPYYSRQWHYALLGNIETIWDEYNGRGVKVGVYDTGVDYANPDLAPNYNSALHVTYKNVVYDGKPNDSSTDDQSHGTAVAGLIAAAGNNGIGVIGGGWGASITGVNIFDTTSPLYLNADNKLGIYEALKQMAKFDVVNHSWGGQGGFSAWNSSEQAGYTYAATNGRAGLGTVVVQSAGNDNIDAGNSARSASRFTVTVAATLQDGFATAYSSYGSSVLVTAPGSPGGLANATIVTTDRSGVKGYNPGNDEFDGSGNYTAHFNGTSAAAPIVSGVVTLMLQANKDLGWRDVQNILAASSTHTGSAIGAGPGTNENGTWKINGGNDWNGGGRHFSIDYGYGMLDAYNAARMAEAWKIFYPAALKSSNEQKAETAVLNVNKAFIDGGVTNYTFNVAKNINIEHIDLSIKYSHDDGRQIKFNLISPDGTVSKAVDYSFYNKIFYGTFTDYLGLDDLRGTLSAGTWTLQIIDSALGSTGSVSQVKFTAFGASVAADDVYHYTDELSDMAALTGQANRTSLSDTDGGSDWIDAAAVASASTVNLGAGTATIDGVPLTVSNVENVVAGDGADQLTGNGVANKLYGMRGNDVLVGGGGADTLVGGAGNDTLNGEAGSDSLNGGAGDDTYVLGAETDGIIESGGIDTINSTVMRSLAGFAAVENLTLLGSNPINGTGNGLDNTLTGNDGNNVLDGGIGLDTLRGGEGNDTYVLGKGNDFVEDTAGIDTITSTITRSLAGYADIENLTLLGSTPINGTGNDSDNIITGNSVVNVLDGGAGADTLMGGGGNDTYVLGAESDTVVDTAGIDTITSIVTRSLAGYATIENLTLLGGDAIDGTGNGLGNAILGNGASNALSGGGGADVLTGGAGADTLTGGDGIDRFVFLTAGDSPSGSGMDAISDFQDVGVDRIDLAALFGGTLTYRHAAAFSAANQVRIDDVAGDDVVVQVNLDSDLTTSETDIRLASTTLASMAAGDFIL